MARSGDLGWAGSGIWARGKSLETSPKSESRKEWVETEDDGKSSCEKLRVVLGKLLVVAVCQNTHVKNTINAQVPKHVISDLPNLREFA